MAIRMWPKTFDEGLIFGYQQYPFLVTCHEHANLNEVLTCQDNEYVINIANIV